MRNWESWYWYSTRNHGDRKGRKLRNTVLNNLRTALLDLLPLVRLGWVFQQLVVEIHPAIEDPRCLIQRFWRDLVRMDVMREAMGYAFRHVSKKRGRPHLHAIIASPRGVDTKTVRDYLFTRLKNLPELAKVYIKRPEFTQVYLRRTCDEDKESWEALTPRERRLALESTCLYMTGQLMGKKRRLHWTRRVDQFHAHLLPRLLVTPVVFPLALERECGTLRGHRHFLAP